MLRYIWPTSRGWVIGLSAVAWWLVALVNHTLFALVLAWACLGLFLGSLISALFSLRGFRVMRGTVGNAVSGQIVSLPLRIVNEKRRRRQPVIVSEHVPFALDEAANHVLTPMKGREERFFERHMLAIKRGDYKLDTVILRSGDPAGLFCREKRYSLPFSIIVYPPVETLHDLSLYQHEAYQSNNSAPITIAGTSQDFYGIREYNPSDGMRNIHWKSSARYRKLMVKEYERNAVLSVALFLDANAQMVSKNGGFNLECLTKVAASLCSYCSDLHCMLSFASGGRIPIVIHPRMASEVRAEIMYSLATVRPGNLHLAPLIDEIAPTLPKGTVVYCLTLGDDNKDLFATLSSLMDLGMDVRWFSARKRDFDNERAATKDKFIPKQYALHPVHLKPGIKISETLLNA